MFKTELRKITKEEFKRDMNSQWDGLVERVGRCGGISVGDIFVNSAEVVEIMVHPESDDAWCYILRGHQYYVATLPYEDVGV